MKLKVARSYFNNEQSDEIRLKESHFSIETHPNILTGGESLKLENVNNYKLLQSK